MFFSFITSTINMTFAYISLTTRCKLKPSIFGKDTIHKRHVHIRQNHSFYCSEKYKMVMFPCMQSKCTIISHFFRFLIPCVSCGEVIISSWKKDFVMWIIAQYITVLYVLKNISSKFNDFIDLPKLLHWPVPSSRMWGMWLSEHKHAL